MIRDWRMRDTFSLLACLAVAAVVQGWIASGARTVMGSGDAMNYLLLAEYYRDFLHGTDPATADLYRTTRFPPLFPLLLGASGAGPDAQPIAYAVGAACVVVCIALAWLWVRAQGASSASATVLSLALALNPGFFLVTLNPMSEPLGMSLYLAALLAAGSQANEQARRPLAALLGGLAPLARSACIALAAAWALQGLFSRSHRGRGLFCALLAAAPLAVWMAQRSTLPGAESYLRSLTPRLLLEGVGGWQGLFFLQPQRLLAGLVHDFAPVASPVSQVCVPLIALLALAGCVIRCRRNTLDGWFLAVSLAIVLLWPYPSEIARLLVFVLPPILLCSLEGARSAIERLGVRANSTVAACLLALLFAGAGSATAARFVDRATLVTDPLLAAHQREQVYFLAPDDVTAVHLLERIAIEYNTVVESARHVGADECVYAVEPALFRLHAGIRAVQYPRRLDAGRPARDQLDRCRFHYLSAAHYEGAGYSSFHLAPEIRSFTRPLLLARHDEGEGPTPVAVLLVREAQQPEATHE